MNERILTLRPDPGKTGVNILRRRYDMVRSAILEALADREPITFTQLATAIDALIGDTFDGSVAWYVTTVKLDLEARSLIEHISRTRPQQLRLTGMGREALKT